MWSLSENGKRDIAAIALTVVLATFTYFVGKHQQAETDKEAADHARVVQDSVVAVQVQAVADSVTREAMAYRAPIQKTVGRVAQASAATDTAHTVQDAARERLLQVTRDSLAPIAQRESAATAFASADSLEHLRWNTERATRQRAMDLMATALQKDTAAFREKDEAYAKQGIVLRDVKIELKDAKDAQHGVWHGILVGLASAVSGAACGAVGSLGGPAVAVGAGVVCAGLVGGIVR